MACPFFKPSRRLDSGGWDPAPRLPLGDAWGGACTASGGMVEPPESQQRGLCNSGYARGRCDHFPDGEDADAVRFSMGAGERLIYILEKNHAPVEHGEINSATDPREPLASLARAFMESYQRTAESGRASRGVSASGG